MSNMPRLPRQEPFPPPPEDNQTVNQPPVSHPLHRVPGGGEDNKSRQGFKSKLLLIVALLITIIAIGTLLFINIQKAPDPIDPNNPGTTPDQPTPTPTQPAAAITDPSEYYNDPEILELEALMKQINAHIDTTDLREPELDPPSLETGISF